MAVDEQLGPTDVAAAFVKDGELIVVDGRMQAWKFVGGQKDAAGDEVPQPDGVEQCVVVGEKLTVLDSSGVCWTYLPASSSWAEGPTMEYAEQQGGDKEALPWIKGPIIEGSAVKADELRRAKATIDASQADDEGSGSSKSKKKAKEPA